MLVRTWKRCNALMHKLDKARDDLQVISRDKAIDPSIIQKIDETLETLWWQISMADDYFITGDYWKDGEQNDIIIKKQHAENWERGIEKTISMLMGE